MKRSTYEQFAIVRSDSASLFTEELNAEVFRLKDNHPVVSFSESIPFYAQIKYVVEVVEAETEADRRQLNGVHFVCSQCPFFQAPKKDDGTEDKRCKWGDCEHAELGRTFKASPACDKLYELIEEGGVKLCFTE